MAKQRPATDSLAWAAIQLTRPWNVLMIVVAMGLITESLLLPAFGGELPPHQQAIFALGTLAMATTIMSTFHGRMSRMPAQAGESVTGRCLAMRGVN